ncbi:MAG: LysM peptidoglycan-binding domain-containing protein [Pseudomonadota bacterium]
MVLLKVFPKRFFRSFLAILCLLSMGPLIADEADFPLPPSLEPAVNFWIKVYTDADTESGFLHDSVNLDVIYAKLPRDSALIDKQRTQIVRDLQVLATGKRTSLTDAQQHILELWGTGVTNERLRLAAEDVRWQLGQSDRYQEGLYRSGAYLPHIRAVARSLGMPEELASLPHVESSFHPGAMSQVAASGMFQFMRETAQRFMRVDPLVDERLDPYKSAYGAMKLLKENYEDLGNWPLALTAYNHGTGGMMRAVKASGTKDIGEIVENYKGPRFGFASRNFYAQFLAARYVETNAEKFYGPVARLSAPQFNEFEMTGFVDAAVVAKTLGLSVDALKQDNPALLGQVWNGSKRIPKGYIVKINRDKFQGDLASTINTIAASDFHTAQVQDQNHIVRNGDSLSTIARQYKTSVAELVAINQLRNRNAIRVGQKLILPQQNGTVPTLIVNSSEPVAATPSQGNRYTIARGDTLSSISNRFKVPTRTLMALNNLSNKSILQPGQKLLLKAEQSQPVAVKTIATELQQSVQAPVGSVPAIQNAEEQPMAVASMVSSMNPADYAVTAEGMIEVLPEETLGHYADWLRVDSKELYSLNSLRSENAVRVGSKLKLDFTRVDRERFQTRRQQFHSNLQSQYFAAWRISETTNYRIKQSDSLAGLARSNDIPMWLFRQYNPGVDISRIQVGQTIVIPKVERLTN